MFEQMPFSEKYPVFRKLAEIGDLRKLSREELELYDEDIKNMRDIYATRKFDEKRLLGGSLIGSRLFMPLHHANVCTAYSLDLHQLMIQAN